MKLNWAFAVVLALLFSSFFFTLLHYGDIANAKPFELYALFVTLAIAVALGLWFHYLQQEDNKKTQALVTDTKAPTESATALKAKDSASGSSPTLVSTIIIANHGCINKTLLTKNISETATAPIDKTIGVIRLTSFTG